MTERKPVNNNVDEAVVALEQWYTILDGFSVAACTSAIVRTGVSRFDQQLRGLDDILSMAYEMRQRVGRSTASTKE